MAGLGPLQNASNVLLTTNPGTLMNMTETILDWFQLLTFEKITKSVVNFKLQEVCTVQQFYGVVQVFSPTQLMIKPQGQRDWNWKTIHSFPTLVLNTDDVIIYQGQAHRIMLKIDYVTHGYVEYHMIEDYTGSSPTVTNYLTAESGDILTTESGEPIDT